MRFSGVMVLVATVAACKNTPEPPASNRASDDVAPPAAKRDVFEGTISGHPFTIAIPDGKLASSNASAYAWHAGAGTVELADSGPIDEQTRHLVARSPRTIMRDNDGLWVVTEVVTTAGGRTFTCLHRQPVERADSLEAQQATARGVAACTSLAIH